jgi:hypothetical protein
MVEMAKDLVAAANITVNSSNTLCTWRSQELELEPDITSCDGVEDLGNILPM